MAGWWAALVLLSFFCVYGPVVLFVSLRPKASLPKLRFLVSKEKSFPDVHIFCMHADEPDLLADWAAYHAAIFGKHHVHILDNNSTMAQSLVVLQLLRSAGFDVSSGADFVAKGVFLTRAMHKIQNSFLVPLDVDEFLVLKKHDSFVVDKQQILEAFRRLPIDGRRYMFSKFLALACQVPEENSPHQFHFRRALEQTRFTDLSEPTGFDFLGNPNYTTTLPKTFFWSDGFVSTDDGNHWGEDAGNCGRKGLECFHLDTGLGIVHFAALFWEAQKRKAMRGALRQGHIERVEAGQNCTAGRAGMQYCDFYQTFKATGEEAMRDTYYSGIRRACQKSSWENTAISDFLLKAAIDAK